LCTHGEKNIASHRIAEHFLQLQVELLEDAFGNVADDEQDE
jgi:hypothetical protein